MTPTEFYGWQVLWYVFGTLASFVAALLFWTKGPAAVGGKMEYLGQTTWKLGGAAAIFVIVLASFHFINPLRELSDYKRVLVIYQTAPQVQHTAVGKHGVWTITADKIDSERIRLDPDAVVMEMIPFDAIESLLPDADGRSFSTARAVPVGTYKFRVTEKDTGKSREFRMEVPPGPAH